MVRHASTIAARRAARTAAAALAWLALIGITLPACAPSSRAGVPGGAGLRPDAPSERSPFGNVLVKGPPGAVAQMLAVQTLAGFGAGQGVFSRDGYIYLYGDLITITDPTRRGVIREYRLDLVGTDPRDPRRGLPQLAYTGRQIRLTVNGEEVAGHPTGLTHHPVYGTFLGNTVNQRGTILHINWERALAQGTLDGCILNTTADDAARNGTRPEFVELDGAWYIATSDYGPEGNGLRLMDPVRLAATPRTSEPGVVVTSVPCGPFTQTISHDDARDRMVLVQNITPGRGYRLTTVGVREVLLGADVRDVPTLDMSYPTTELEGYLSLDPWLAGRLGAGYVLLLDAFDTDNAHFALVRLP